MTQRNDHTVDRNPAMTRDAQVMLRNMLGGHSAATLLASRHWPTSLREQMTNLCREARHNQIPIEQLLVCIKRAWRTVPHARIALGEYGEDVLTSLVTICIEEYFADAERTRNA